MELPINNQSKWLPRMTQSIFQPFLEPAPLVEEDIVMMSLPRVERFLHEAYCKQEPLKLLIEYYNPQEQLEMTEIEALILTPVHYHNYVKVQVGQESFHLTLNQIINVTAITESLIA